MDGGHVEAGVLRGVACGWLPPEHLCWKALDVVELLDLSAFENSYRDDGRGGAAYPPASLIALLLYCYSKGVRSSRRIEQACWDDVGCRIITAKRRVDHSTVARFVRRHRVALKYGLGTLLHRSRS
ncbi:transposase [Streptomyces sp. NPDC000877]|uniref:transposase n=1 Tax=unclassified Streptomyces TaxID=2593676 RepID=UPI00332B55C4